MDSANVYLLNKEGDVQYGLNWAFEPDTDNLRIEKGRTETSRDGNEGYLQLSPEVWHSEFFPVRGNYFYAVADDGQEFIFERVSKNDEGTQLSTPEDNHIIGKWIRKRLGVKDCSKIKKSDIDAYGRSSIKFIKITDRYYKMDFSNSNLSPLPFPHNRIIFGAPGTGKSFQLKKEQKKYFDESHFERVTFHPNYSYAQFVGTYKPSMKKNNTSVFDSDKKWILEVLTDKNKTAQEKYDVLFDKFKGDGLTRLPILLGLYSDDDFKTRKQDGTPAVGDNSVERNHGKAIRPYVSLYNDNSSSEEITYEYTPGPFIRVLEKALKNPNENHLLLIEEINRANVAAVFGDVFQLLDRDSDGKSEYEIDASNDLEKYLNDNGITLENHKLKIPNNMYIWATMNSADQGVMPLDAAFKRRWNFEYLNIDANENEVKDIEIPSPQDGDKKSTFVKWNRFRKALNSKLNKEPSLNVNEDKLLGPFFISLKNLQNAKTEPEKFIDLFKSKILMYLFEDVCKMNPKALFTGIDTDGRLHYSDVCEQFDKKGIGIFGLTEADLLKFDVPNQEEK